MTDAWKLSDAIDTVAHHVVRAAARWALLGGHVGWEDYPEIGEHDWVAVSRRARQIANSHSPTDYIAAYELLESRAQAAEA